MEKDIINPHTCIHQDLAECHHGEHVHQCKPELCSCKKDESPSPKPGTQEWDDLIEEIRASEARTDAVRKSMEEQGLDFDEEYRKWEACADNIV